MEVHNFRRRAAKSLDPLPRGMPSFVASPSGKPPPKSNKASCCRHFSDLTSASLQETLRRLIKLPVYIYDFLLDSDDLLQRQRPVRFVHSLALRDSCPSFLLFLSNHHHPFSQSHLTILHVPFFISSISLYAFHHKTRTALPRLVFGCVRRRLPWGARSHGSGHQWS